MCKVRVSTCLLSANDQIRSLSDEISKCTLPYWFSSLKGYFFVSMCSLAGLESCSTLLMIITADALTNSCSLALKSALAENLSHVTREKEKMKADVIIIMYIYHALINALSTRMKYYYYHKADGTVTFPSLLFQLVPVFAALLTGPQLLLLRFCNSKETPTW